ncbi:MAG: hypothetical protein M3Z56_04280 [Bacteroidota bacterium]|nr:hypothetical protein [Bacteroidota bacterium]
MKKLSLVLLIFSVSCTVALRMTVSNIANGTVVTNGKLFATACQQRAAEYRA